MSASAPNGALRNGALLLILACFAVSGALRASEALQYVDFSGFGAPAAGTDASAPAMAKPEAESEAAEADDGAGAVGKTSMEKPSEETATSEEAQNLAEETVLAMADEEAAILAGEISTASTKDDKANSGAAPTRLPPSATDADAAARLLESLRAREAELDAFAERLRERQLELDAAAKRVEERIRDLERSKEEFAALVASVDQAAERDVEHLVEMYSKMKPKEAGQLFNAMAPTFAAGFLGRMRSDKASAIMAQMATDKAYAVSLELAGRNVQRRPDAPERGQ